MPVTAHRNATAHCPKCGEELSIVLPMDFALFAATTTAFARVHAARCNAVALVGPSSPEQAQP
jgi:hypothetical protein